MGRPPQQQLYDEKLIVCGVTELQQAVNRQQHGMYPNGRTPLEQFDRYSEEHRELFHETVMFDGSKQMRERLGNEVADVIISVMGIATVTSINMGPVVARAFSTMCDKYDLRELSALREQGYSQDEAVAKRKEAWRSH